jgi:hypothetical protein
MLRNGVARELLPIYLRDHYAASMAGVALAERIERAARADKGGPVELATLAKEIAADRNTLRDVMQALAIEPNQLKNALARIVERLSRLKLNGRLRGRSPLSRVVELETLGAGIHAKRDLWSTLESVVSAEKADADFNELQARADEQLAVVERLRGIASTRAFDGGTTRPRSR